MSDLTLREDFRVLSLEIKELVCPAPEAEENSGLQSASSLSQEALSPVLSDDPLDSQTASPPHKSSRGFEQEICEKAFVPRTKSNISEDTTNPISLRIQVLNNHETGKFVRVGIIVNKKHHLYRKPSLFDDVALGFSNVIDSIVKRPSIQSLHASEHSQHSDSGMGNTDDYPCPPSSHSINPSVSIQEVWGNITRPFLKPPKVVPVLDEDQSSHTATDWIASTGSDDSKEKSSLIRLCSSTTPLNERAEKSKEEKKNLPGWMDKATLSGFGTLLGRKSLSSVIRTTQKDAGDESDPIVRAPVDSERHKPQHLLETLFIKPSEKDSEVDVPHDNVGSELRSASNKASGNDVPGDNEAEARVHSLAHSARDFAETPAVDDASTSSRQENLTAGSPPIDDMLSAQNALFARALSHIEKVKEVCSTLIESTATSEGTIRSDLVSDLCNSIERVLSLSMRARPRIKKPAPPPGLKFFTDIVDKIPSRQNTPFHVLCEAQHMMLGSAISFDLGVDVIESITYLSGSSEKLQAWIRSSLNSRCLEKRMQYLMALEDLWDRWYEGGSGMDSDELRNKLVQSLEGLDGLAFFLRVEKSPKKEEENGAHKEVADKHDVPQKAVGPLLKSCSKSKKRVVDFDVEPSLSFDSMLPSVSLAPMPENFFERAEPMSPTQLAQAMGMGADSQTEEETTTGLFSSQRDEHEERVLSSEDEILLKNVMGDACHVHLLSGDDQIQESDIQHSEGLAAIKTDNFLDLADADQKIAEVESKLGVNQVNEDVDTDPGFCATNENLIGQLDDVSEGSSLKHTTSSETLSTSQILADEVACLESNSSGEINARTTEGIIRDAISQAGCESPAEESAEDASKRFYLLGTVLSLCEEESELLEASGLGFTSEDLGHGMHPCLGDKDSSLSDLSTLSELPQEVKNKEKVTIRESLCSVSTLTRLDLFIKKQVVPHPRERFPVAKGGDSHGASCEDIPIGVWKDVDVLRSETVEGSSRPYTSYVIEVTASDGTSWQVSRRFRDLVALRKALKLCDGVSLPTSWDNIKKSRHITGSSRLSPHIVDARNALMRQSLWDLRVAYPGCLSWKDVAAFLDAPLHVLKGIKSRTGGLATEPIDAGEVQTRENASETEYDSRVRLIVDLSPARADEELISLQKGKCSNCHGPLPSRSISRGFSSYLWLSTKSAGPRRCEYTNLLYCHNCHGNDTSVIPALVLHNWDFSEKPVSVASKDYLKSIKSLPILCLGAVNPGLFARVPLLANVQSLRQKVVKTLSIVRGAGPEGTVMAEKFISDSGAYGYLLENPDFWSLRDLIDISKGGAFSSLPRWLECASGKVGHMATSALLG